MQKVAILGGNRIPFARANTAYSQIGNQQMLTAALNGLVERFNLKGTRLGLVAGGAVLKHSRDFNLTRESALGTQLDPATPCMDIQQACATSLQAAVLIGNEIALGQIEAGIACGVDSASDPPIAVNEELASIENVLPQAVASLGVGGRLAVISFHSLEDRIVKDFFRVQSKDLVNPPYERIYDVERKATLKEVNRKPITPSEEEIKMNPRARSAKLRIVEKL